MREKPLNGFSRISTQPSIRFVEVTVICQQSGDFLPFLQGQISAPFPVEKMYSGVIYFRRSMYDNMNIGNAKIRAKEKQVLPNCSCDLCNVDLYLLIAIRGLNAKLFHLHFEKKFTGVGNTSNFSGKNR